MTADVVRYDYLLARVPRAEHRISELNAGVAAAGRIRAVQSATWLTATT
jgi:hypothetical protein